MVWRARPEKGQRNGREPARIAGRRNPLRWDQSQVGAGLEILVGAVRAVHERDSTMTFGIVSVPRTPTLGGRKKTGSHARWFRSVKTGLNRARNICQALNVRRTGCSARD